MNKKILIPILIAIMLANQLVSAVIFDVETARQEEWERYETYKEDYIQFHDLEQYKEYISEYDMQRRFGFYSSSYYYIPPHVLEAKYNPPLQGEVYATPTRGMETSLSRPSAVRFYAEETNGRYTGFIPGDLNGKRFDHPDAYGTNMGYMTTNYAPINSYNYNYGYEPNSNYYARISTQYSPGYYVVGYI